MSVEMRRDASLWSQTFALLWKNLLLKWRRKWHTVLEWLQHLAFVLLLFFFTSSLEDTRMPYLSPAADLGRLDKFNITDVVVGYSLKSSAAHKIMQKVHKSGRMPGITIEGISNETEMLRLVTEREMVAVTFESEFTYYIQYPSYNVPPANDYLVYRRTCYDADSCTPTLYMRSGFLTLQAAIDAAIIEVATNHSVWDSMASTEAVKMASTNVISRTILHLGFFILVMCMCYTSLSYLLTIYIAKERKEQREIMRMMGLRDLAFWLSWGLLYALYVLIIANLMALVTTTFVFVESSYGVILLLFFLYGISMICFTFMLCALLRKPRLVAISGFFITLFLSSLSTLPLVNVLPVFLEVVLCVFAPFAFSVGITQSIHMETDFEGVFFSDITGESSHLLTSYITLLLDCVLYILLTLYFDKILADRHGMRHEALFFLRSSYWSRGKKTPVPLDPEVRGTTAGIGDYIEKVPVELQGREAIRINKVKKIYSGKDKKTEALRGLDLDIYEGQITALLGHSGAGKTTLLNILSGMSTSTSGSASICNHPLSDIQHLEEIQKRIGFCPQFDIKFDQLTVRENLKLFCRIKGIAARDVASEVEKIVSDLAMSHFQNVLANKLSGGQRRKLTLAIALLGDPEVLLLDEPTAGLDPISRHRVWAILKERKSDGVTLFSTQFMDEADILADRKAVLSNGRLKCVGSSLFLKRNWGIGYHLRMQVSPSCNPDAITSVIQQDVSSAKLATQNVEDLTFTLPFDKMDSFPALFSHLDQHVGLDVMSYGVSITTLDDVFLKLEGEEEIEKGDYGVFAQSDQNEDEERDLEVEDSVLLMSDSGSATLHGLALWRQQVVTVARIRFLKLKHDMKNFRSILLLLVLFILPLITTTILVYSMHTIHNWKLAPNLYFRGEGHRAHKYYTRLLLNNNTGSPIKDFVNGIKAQGVSVEVVDGPYNMNITGYNGAIEVSLQDENYRFKIIGNPRALNGLPVLVNILSNAFLKSFRSTEKIEIWTKPIQTNTNYDSYHMVFAVGMLFMYFASGLAPHFAMSSVQDYKIKARSQLRISGLFPSAYWCGQALVDIALYWLLLFLMIAILFAFNYKIILAFWEVALLILEILAYGASMVLYVYLISFIFKKGKVHADRWSFLFVVLAMVLGPLPFYSLFLMDLSSLLIASLFLVPPCNLGAFLSHLTFWIFFGAEERPTELFLHLIMPCCQIITFWGVLWFLEWRFGTRCLKTDPIFRFSQRKHECKPNPEELEDADEEVLAERERVKTWKDTTNVEEKPTIIVDSLRKEFKEKAGSFTCKKRMKKAAARHVSFCVKKGEVLGLLGPNGAGKTTSVLMLAGELKPTAGEVILCGAGEDSTAFMGFCPQFSPLWPTLTVKEHLEIYAAVKGMKKDDADQAIKRVSEALELKLHLNKPAKKLSAGVSRKVCFAISMLGNPTVALLDEPSTGLDPKGQQRLWRAIRAAFRNKERGAILTTHYMEEAEAVCDRVAIMVSGKLRCIGSIQQLKSKFGKGYLLEMKVKDSQRADEIHQEVVRMFPQADRQDRFSSLLVYKIPMENVQSLSQAFSQLEEAKRAHDIEEYSFSQSTLEQVFLELAKEQEKEDCDQDAMFKWRPLKTESA
ncbi:ABC-type organic anion transporter ABCA8-like isoform X1 [Bufo bufo]|uniref:ABC-type organic anion transporter ABCA8-like isoform X1 n=2 Tax=Bufo bufo TaxID=8384 RepID=UPI001ABE3DDA|nr:ABC-type organic anion transporter ABCA8-like isoform X1 [Bufo bufo]